MVITIRLTKSDFFSSFRFVSFFVHLCISFSAFRICMKWPWMVLLICVNVYINRLLDQYLCFSGGSSLHRRWEFGIGNSLVFVVYSAVSRQKFCSSIIFSLIFLFFAEQLLTPSSSRECERLVWRRVDPLLLCIIFLSERDKNRHQWRFWRWITAIWWISDWRSS